LKKKTKKNPKSREEGKKKKKGTTLKLVILSLLKHKALLTETLLTQLGWSGVTFVSLPSNIPTLNS